MDWDQYSRFLNVKGETRQERAIYETKQSIQKRAVRSPAYKTVLIDGTSQNVVITAGSELFVKKINAMPEEHIYAGSVVQWNNRHWIITMTDCEDSIYQRGMMYACNVCLKWQNTSGQIISRYGYTEDLAQFTSGTVASRVMDSIQTVLKIRMPMDQETIKLRRDKRFLLDVVTDDPSAYILSNRNVITENYEPTDATSTGSFDGRGKLLLLTLTQTQLSKADNTDLMIADYFTPSASSTSAHQSVVIQHAGTNKLKAGGTYKTFTATFYDEEGAVINNVTPHWSLTTVDGFENHFTYTTTASGQFKVKVLDDISIVASIVRISVNDGTEQNSAYIDMEVVSIYG